MWMLQRDVDAPVLHAEWILKKYQELTAIQLMPTTQQNTLHIANVERENEWKFCVEERTKFEQ